MIESLFILSPRGDSILQRSFRKRGLKNGGELFLKHLRRGGGPVINIEECETTFAYLKRCGLYFVFSLGAVSIPLSVCMDLLESLVNIVKDVCGVLSEDNLRRNFLLLNEVVDEMYDYGVPVVHKTQQLTGALCSTAAGGGGGAAAANDVVARLSASATLAINTLAEAAAGGGAQHNATLPAPKTVPSHASLMPIGKNSGSEIFIDIVDRVSAEIDAATGEVIRSSLDGSIVVKSYLTSYPDLKLGLNEDITIDNPYMETHTPGASVALEDCVFDQCVDYSNLAEQKFLTFNPPQGEFVLMRYRAQKFTVPLVVVAKCSVAAGGRVELSAVIKCEAQGGVNGTVSVDLALPAWAEAVSVSSKTAEARKQAATYLPAEKRVQWSARSVERGMGFTVKFDVAATAPQALRDAVARADARLVEQYVHPLVLSFDLPMHSSSRLQIRYLRCGLGLTPPQRWVRYLTQSGSFVARFTG